MIVNGLGLHSLGVVNGIGVNANGKGREGNHGFFVTVCCQNADTTNK